MGMDLRGCGLSFNWAAWDRLICLLDKWGVDTQELTRHNDGHVITRNTCLAIAWAIEAHLAELDGEEQAWLGPQIEQWRACFGCQQT